MIIGREPRIGSYRVIEKFALFPITAGRETRWLETVHIFQVYIYTHEWKNYHFITKEIYDSYMEDK